MKPMQNERYVSEIENIFSMKSQIDGHRFQQLNQFCLSGLYWLGCLAGGFYALQFWISCKSYFEPLMRTLSSYIGFIDVSCNFCNICDLKSLAYFIIPSKSSKLNIFSWSLLEWVNGCSQWVQLHPSIFKKCY